MNWHVTRSHPLFGRRTGASACLLIACLLASCAARSDTTQPTTRRTMTTTTVDPTQLARFSVIFAYQQFWAVLPLVDQQPAEQTAGILQAIAEEPELGRQIAAANQRRTRGIHLYGETIPHVTSMTGAEGSDASIEDCADTSHTGTVENRTNKTVTRNPQRTHITAHLHRTSELGHWKVHELTAIEPADCGQSH